MTGHSGVDRLASTVIEAARRAMDRGHWSEAAELARQVLAVMPDDPAATALLEAADAEGRVAAVERGRCYLTVLFSDVVGSTALSEALDPEQYVQAIGAYRDVVRSAIERHAGHVDQFQGDGVVAYFGYPAVAEDDQVRAVDAALDIVRAVPEAGRDVGVELASRVGVHMGRTVMTSPELGVRERSAAIGFVTNVAARIQTLATPGSVVVSEAMLDAIGPYFELEPVGSEPLRGVSESIKVFHVLETRAPSIIGDERLAAPLVDRSERRRIDAALAAAVQHSDGPRALVITGEPGIGKSRLARYGMELARSSGAAVIEINCGRGFRNVGLGAVRRGIEKALAADTLHDPHATRGALRQRAKTVGLSETSTSALESLLVDTGGTGAELAPDRLHEAIIDGLCEWIAAEADAAPVALVVEDLHWADDTAIETLRRLVSRGLPRGVLVLMTARADGLPEPIARLVDDPIELGPLTADDAQELVVAFAGEGALDRDEIRALARRGEGVPLFTEHLAMAATTAAGLAGEPLPHTLEGLLQVRVENTGAGRGAAEVAAVIGREFSFELLERTLVELGASAPLQPGGLRPALRTLQRTGLVEADARGSMRFRHSLVRDTAYEMQLRAELPRRHAAVARAMVALTGPDASPESRAYHLEQAGELVEAAVAYLRAAERATELGEFDLALDHLRSAGAAVGQVEGVDARRIELAGCMQVGAVASASFGFLREDAEQAYLRALELCDLIAAEEGADVGVDVQLVTALGGLWSKEVVSGDLAAAARVTDRIERLLDRTPADLAPEIQRFVLACRGFEQLYAGTTSDGVRTLAAASAMQPGAVAIPWGVPHDVVAATDALLASGLTLEGDDARADAVIERALQRTRGLPFPAGPFSEGVVLVYLAYMWRLRGDSAQARSAGEAISAIGDRHGFREHAVLGQILAFTASAVDGDADACRALETTLELWRTGGGGLAVPVLLTELAEGWLRAGDAARARAAAREAEVMMIETGQRGSEPEVVRIGALLDAAAGASDALVLSGLTRAATLAVESGSLRFAERALRDASVLLDGRPNEPLAQLAARLAAELPAAAAERGCALETMLSARQA